MILAFDLGALDVHVTAIADLDVHLGWHGGASGRQPGKNLFDRSERGRV